MKHQPANQTEPKTPNTKAVVTHKTATQTTIKAQSPQPKRASAVVTDDALFSMRKFDYENDLPIVYSEKYNIYMMGLELTHQFDSKKYKKMAKQLSDDFLDTTFARHRRSDETLAEDEEPDNPSMQSRRLRYLAPNRPVTIDELLLHHKANYVDIIHQEKSVLARITEVWLLNLIPMAVIESRLLNPIKWQVAGTIFATHLAMQHGWSINLGGGFHQASTDYGETFCIFSDVLVAMKYVWRKHPLQKFMIIDLDAHQATGIERDLVELSGKRREMVYILDIFNDTINPPDPTADQGINLRVQLGRFTGDATYMDRLEKALATAFASFKPTLIFYVAGQDILKNDQLGLMNISDDVLKKRDELVFTYATERNKCPIVMLLGGGYLSRGSKVQADSIRNLYAKGLIWGGQKSGSRTLTRPMMKKSVKKSASKKSPVTIHHSKKDLSSRSPSSTGIDAVSQSVSGSNGRRTFKVIRLSGAHKTTKTANATSTKTVTKGAHQSAGADGHGSKKHHASK